MADTSPPGVDDSTASGVDDHDDSVGGVAGGGEEAAAAAAASASAGAAGAADAGGEEGDTPQFLLANFDSDSTKREIGNEAVWTLSSAKSGNGVDQLRDNDINTFWQSDGTQPHEVNIQFLCKKSICAISFYLEHKLDESYTPKVRFEQNQKTNRIVLRVLCLCCMRVLFFLPATVGPMCRAWGICSGS